MNHLKLTLTLALMLPAAAWAEADAGAPAYAEVSDDEIFGGAMADALDYDDVKDWRDEPDTDVVAKRDAKDTGLLKALKGDAASALASVFNQESASNIDAALAGIGDSKKVAAAMPEQRGTGASAYDAPSAMAVFENSGKSSGRASPDFERTRPTLQPAAKVISPTQAAVNRIVDAANGCLKALRWKAGPEAEATSTIALEVSIDAEGWLSLLTAPGDGARGANSMIACLNDRLGDHAFNGAGPLDLELQFDLNE